MKARASLLWVLVFAGAASAQEARPSEDSMFGAPPAAAPDAGVALAPGSIAPVPVTLAAPPAAPSDAREAEALTGKPIEDAFRTGRVADDPLRIGGQLYLRGIVQANDRNIFARSTTSFPTLLDAFLDARPNDHLRAMVLGRLIYDPLQTTATLPGVTTTTAAANPQVVLDRAWLSFDIARAVFITVGRQHVRWGTAHIWNPTDFLASARRDPLAQFDARVGVSMIKVHIPVEALGWNFYAVGVFEQTQRPGSLGVGGSGSTLLPQVGNNVYGTAGVGNALHDIGGAIRGEFVVGHTELGIDGLAQRGRVPRLGVDVSSGIGPVDLYAEAALSKGSDVSLFQVNPSPQPAQGLDGLVLPRSNTDWTVGVAAGASYSIVLGDADTLVLSGEYFYNSAGYSNPALYPYLLFTGNYQPFYTGKHYASLGASIVGPGNWDKVTFSLTNLANLSDYSFISRLDFIIRVLSYLQVEAYAAGHYGNRGGELKLGFDTPAGTLGGTAIPAISIPAPVLDLGIGLRLSI